MAPTMEEMLPDGHAVEKSLLRRGLVSHFESVAALRAAALPGDDVRVVFVDGFAKGGDGGEGFFRFDSASSKGDDGGIVIQPAAATGAGRWVRLTEGRPYSASVSRSASGLKGSRPEEIVARA